MSDDIALLKLEQAREVLQEFGLDCWLMLARETGMLGEGDPSLNLLVPTSVVGLSAFLVTRTGQFYAICANYDASMLKATGVFDRVIDYELGIDPYLHDLLEEINPSQIGVNYSQDDFSVDGLSYGLYLKLQSILKDTPYGQRLVSAEPVAVAVRGRKIEPEIQRLRAASSTTQAIWSELTDFLRPGISELEIMEFVHQQCEEHGVETAWDSQWCPGITAGPHSEGGHNKPRADIKVEAGTIVSIDFGVKQNGYVTDFQRTWYVPSTSQPTPPQEAVVAGETVRKSIRKAKEAIQPGMLGYEIDQIGRNIIVEGGYREFKHGLGHQVGRSAHDGATLLAPKDWPRYTTRATGVLEVGNVFTLAPSVATELGHYGGEEMVLVTETGAEWLSPPQRELWITRG